MRQLTGLDAQFLALETPRQYGHVGGLAIVDPASAPRGTLALADIHALMTERLPLLPPFRWRLAEVPLGLDYPYWIDDANFDLDFHLRELALPAPGSDVQLAEQLARIVARPLDRSRPLWEAYLISGLTRGRVALLTKIHHAVIDGVSGAEILGALLDLTPEGREAPAHGTPARERVPSDVEMLLRGLLGVPRYPLRALAAMPRTIPNIEDVRLFNGIPGVGTLGRLTFRAQQALRREGKLLQRPALRAPRTSFNRRVSPHRRFAFGQLPLDEVKRTKNDFGCTVNDVVVALCTGAVRRWLIEHDELPDEPLVAQIPMSIRTGAQAGTYGNRISLMSVPVFTNEPDPRVRLRRTHEELRDAKERHRAMPAELFQDAAQMVPPAVFARATRATLAVAGSSRGRPPWNLVISNVPGPQVPLYLAGARVQANFPVSTITDGLGLNMTVMSLCGKLDFGLIADREQMPDLARLIDWLGDSLDELHPRERGTRARGRVTPLHG